MTVPFAWVGGKVCARERILPIIESCEREVYVEPFGGSAAILLGKEPERNEIYNDSNGLLCAFFRSLKCPKRARTLRRLNAVSPGSREMWSGLAKMCRAWMDNNVEEFKRLKELEGLERCDDEVALAHALFYCQNFAFGGKFLSSFAVGVDSHFSQRIWLERRRAFGKIVRRMSSVCVERLDFEELIKKYDRETTLFYCDPPYEVELSRQYGAPWTSDDSKRLVDAILASKGSFVVSCYFRPSFQPLIDAGFQRLDFTKRCAICGKPEKALRNKGVLRTETVLWKINRVKPGSFLATQYLF